MKIEGVPVELKVATILLAIMALLPIPLITILPLQKIIFLTTSIKSVSSCFFKSAIALDSMSIVFRAEAKIFWSDIIVAVSIISAKVFYYLIEFLFAFICF
jgi:hypothetical protein